MDPDALAAVIAGYARRFHTAALGTGPTHHVGSPLGAWVVLALAADALDGAAREAAADRLGVSVDDAAGAAAALLDDPHPAVAAAIACWCDGDALGARLGSWVGRLPAVVESGAVPTPADADRWAAERTGGIIERFPVAVDPATVLVLASALATEVAWEEPCGVAAATALGGPWADAVGQVLTRSGGLVHLADTGAAGLVAVAWARSPDDVDVVSVIAAPDVPPPDVIAAAHEVARSAPGADRRSLFAVPLGSGHSWDLTEVVEERPAYEDRVEVAAAVLPAWVATSAHPLLADDRFGFTEVTAHLLGALPPHPDGWEADAAQAAAATYGRRGFAAAAVTALSMRAGAGLAPTRTVPVRTLQARFAHPHAVVAVTTQRRWDGGAPAAGPWDRLPVFSAWVAEPAEVGD